MKLMGEQELARVLRGMDVESINRDRLGIRVASLRAAGIENMEQLCALKVDQINEIKGIGDDAAYLIYTIAGRDPAGGRSGTEGAHFAMTTRMRRAPGCCRR